MLSLSLSFCRKFHRTPSPRESPARLIDPQRQSDSQSDLSSDGQSIESDKSSTVIPSARQLETVTETPLGQFGIANEPSAVSEGSLRLTSIGLTDAEPVINGLSSHTQPELESITTVCERKTIEDPAPEPSISTEGVSTDTGTVTVYSEQTTLAGGDQPTAEKDRPKERKTVTNNSAAR